MTDRRDFIKTLSLAGTSLLLPSPFAAASINPEKTVPNYLSKYKDLYAKDPKAASLAWFNEAKYGLFMHYGLYSIWGRGAWVQLFEKTPVAEYRKLMNEFTARKFDADFITDLALESGMKYVNITTKHHDGFCLFKSAQTDYTSVHAAAKRDLVGELNAACQKKGLGLFLYYSVAADWHHPYFPAKTAGWQYFRPDYAQPQPEYRYKTEKDAERYTAYVKAQLRELVTQYDPAGIWFDPVRGLYARPDLFPMEEFYREIRSLSPHALVSFKQGATGTEDFAAPERKAASLADQIQSDFGAESAALAKRVWEAHHSKHNETCSTLQRGAWSYEPEDNDKRRHLGVQEVMDLLADAKSRNMNLLLNTGPLPEGDIHQGDAETLRKVGKLIG
ncbi:alpha-L-fucosidase [Larkinella terrae]|uniref:alpha-L-fucosidase n=1 Tax=Larkinella terrae TaxID=2025311 RepID=A0A7K0EEY6_9BACT|nr:alpha-L-fucosidase [Larkinella terrae]MRS60377.1 alpha-L-fucosidase precursor [Larkinella terrae]